MNKEQLQTVVDKLPDEFSAEDVYERLLIIEGVREGLAAIERGEEVSLEEARLLAKAWGR